MQYISVGASAVLTKLGRTSPDSPGDVLERIIITVNTPATAEVKITDGVVGSGGVEYVILPNNPGSGIGVYPVVLNMQSKYGQWRITTGDGASVIAVGVFL